MPSHSGKSRLPWLLAAIVFAAATTLYTAAWMYYMRLVPGVELGIDTTQTTRGYIIDRVYPSSPAEGAGLKAKDLIVAVNGKSAVGSNVITAEWLKGRPGQQVTLTVEREAQPMTIAARFRVARDRGPGMPWPQAAAQQVKNTFPLLFWVVGLVVLFLRVEDRNAWLRALTFAGIISASDVPSSIVAAPLQLQPFLKAYRAIFNTFLAGLFYFFFAIFPSRSPIDRRAPWLKWLLLALLGIFGLGGLRAAAPRPLPPVAAFFTPKAAHGIGLFLTYGSIVLGFVSLTWNSAVTRSSEDRRKFKVLLWGTLAGLLPVVMVRGAVEIGGAQVPFWLDFFAVVLAFLFPLSFAYAVVKHRVLEIPILLKRSARYLVVQRGFVMLLLALAVIATVLLANAFSARFATNPKTAIAVGATFGVLLISAGTQVHSRVRKRLDRAFFRSAYDAQQILEELASRTLAVTSRQDLATLLERHIHDALHPESLAIFLQAPDSRLVVHAGQTEWKEFPREIAWFAGLDGSTATLDLDVDTPEVAYLGVPRAECLVPIRGGASAELQGVAILGPRLSEEPYSSSDKRLLASVATQAGIAMRSIAMAEKMAERMEAERRAAQEMEIARQVQAKLLPQQAPELSTLQCAGACIQTRAVGGDYYDFLDLGGGRLGLVLADISGKGISGALLMANLQANLRSHYALALEDIPRLLRSVNHLFYKNTDDNHYATAFFAVYDEGTRRLRYVNCGHNPPLLLRATGDLERLEGTATVLGLFEEWDCEVGQKRMHPGDVLAIYTDGVTESVGAKGEEYGESRLRHVLEGGGHRSARQLLEAVMADVQRFSVGEQADDLTLVIAKAVASD